MKGNETGKWSGETEESKDHLNAICFKSCFPTSVNLPASITIVFS